VPHVTHSNARFLHESQSILSKIVAHWMAGQKPYLRFQSLSLRHHKQACRTKGWENYKKPRGFCPGFRPGEFGGSPQMLLIGPGEWIFLQSLRTAVRSLVSDLFDVTTDSKPAILNPSPSTDKHKPNGICRFDSFHPSQPVTQFKIVCDFAAESP
jgi:hypothetical protein